MEFLAVINTRITDFIVSNGDQSGCRLLHQNPAHHNDLWGILA
jgi:hypothetical protein